MTTKYLLYKSLCLFCASLLMDVVIVVCLLCIILIMFLGDELDKRVGQISDQNQTVIDKARYIKNFGGFPQSVLSRTSHPHLLKTKLVRLSYWSAGLRSGNKKIKGGSFQCSTNILLEKYHYKRRYPIVLILVSGVKYFSNGFTFTWILHQNIMYSDKVKFKLAKITIPPPSNTFALSSPL